MNDALQDMLLHAYSIESAELMARLNEGVALLEESSNRRPELLEQMSRDLHTLKGASTTAGFEAVAIVCQALEECTRELAHGTRSFDDSTLTCLTDALQLMTQVNAGGSDNQLVPILQRLRTSPSAGTSAPRRTRRSRVSTAPPVRHERSAQPVALVASQGDATVAAADQRADALSDPPGLTPYGRLRHLHNQWLLLRQQFATQESRAQDAYWTHFDQAMALFSEQFAAIVRNVERSDDGVVFQAREAVASDWLEGDAAPATATKRILLVDDSTTARNRVRNVLESAGYMVYVAVDGQEALDLLPSLPHLDMLVTDLQMPRMDGTTLCRHVRERTDITQVPIVIVTSRRDVLARTAGLSAGANAYVVKQEFMEGALLATVGQLLS